MRPFADCKTCGSRIAVVWDDDTKMWTGKCWTCGNIIYVTKDRVRRGA